MKMFISFLLVCIAIIFLIALAFGIWRLYKAYKAGLDWLDLHDEDQSNDYPPATAIVISTRHGFPHKVWSQTRASINNGHQDWKTAKCLAVNHYTGTIWVKRGHSHAFTRQLGFLRPQ